MHQTLGVQINLVINQELYGIHQPLPLPPAHIFIFGNVDEKVNFFILFISILIIHDCPKVRKLSVRKPEL